MANMKRGGPTTSICYTKFSLKYFQPNLLMQYIFKQNSLKLFSSSYSTQLKETYLENIIFFINPYFSYYDSFPFNFINWIIQVFA